MRIVSGKYKGRLIRPGKKISARPTTDFAKENLFNILETRIDFEDKDVLDLFAGTGNMSYEFVSRGSRYVLAVEKNKIHYQFIVKIADEMEMTNLEIHKADVFRFLKSSPQRFDIVFADPPYQIKNMNQLPDQILEAGLLKENGILILEHSKESDFSSHPRFYENRRYGSVNFSFFK